MYILLVVYRYFLVILLRELRINTTAGKEQVYGTQFTDDDEGWPITFPISNPEGVNARRKDLGLNSLEDRLREMMEREKHRREQQNK